MQRHGEHGLSLVSLVVVVGIFGVMMVVFLTMMYNSGTSSSDLNSLTSAPHGSTTTTTRGATTTSSTVVQTTAAARTATCLADVQSVSGALATYEATHTSPPPAGTAWATSSAHGGPYLQSWPAVPGYAIRWTGSTLIVVPTRGTSSAGAGTASPPSGCYAH